MGLLDSIFGSKKSDSQVSQNFVDPNMYSMLWGTGAQQAVFDKSGKVKTPARQGTGGILPQAMNLFNQGPQQYYPGYSLVNGQFQPARASTGPTTTGPATQPSDLGTSWMTGGDVPRMSSPSSILPEALRRMFNIPNSQQGGAPATGAPTTGAAPPTDPNLIQSTYAGMNPLQNSVLGQQVNWLTSPGAMAGANAMNQVASGLISGMGNSGTGPGLDLSQYTAPAAGAGIDWNSIRNAYGQTSGMPLGPPGAVSATPAVGGSGGGIGGTRVNHTDYLNSLLGDDSAINPHVQALADQAMRSNTENYLEQIAPQFRSGDRMSGMFGNSRSGIVEARGISDLNRANADAATSLFGNAWESQQQRRAAAANQAMGVEAQRDIARSTLQSQASQAEADRALQAALANQRTGMDYAGLAANYDLGQRGLGVDIARSASDYDLGNRGLGINAGRLAADYDLGLRDSALANRDLSSRNAIAGAGLAQSAAEVPMANLGSLFGVGQAYQTNLQNQINADLERWNFQQQAPWQNFMNLMSILQPNAGLGGAQTGQAQQRGRDSIFGQLMGVGG